MGRQITIYIIFGVQIPIGKENEPTPNYVFGSLMHIIERFVKEKWDEYCKMIIYDSEIECEIISDMLKEDVKIPNTDYTIGFYYVPEYDDPCAFIQLKKITYQTIQMPDVSPMPFTLPKQEEIEKFECTLRKWNIGLKYGQFIVKKDIS